MENFLKDIPELWITFGGLIHQDFMSGITEIIQGFNPSQRDEIHALLVEILSDKYSNTERVQFWLDSTASFFVLESEIELWLKEVLAIVEKERTN